MAHAENSAIVIMSLALQKPHAEIKLRGDGYLLVIRQAHPDKGGVVSANERDIGVATATVLGASVTKPLRKDRVGQDPYWQKER
jgi:hypothetical protein